MAKSFSRDEVNDLGLNQLSQDRLANAEDALNGFASLFGKKWVSSYFGGSKATIFVLRLTAAWQDWKTVSSLPHAAELLEKWKVGFTNAGVLLEVQVAASLLRITPDVELFPPVGTRVADLRFRMASAYPGWIYVEASQRQLSDVLERAESILGKVANALAVAVQGLHGKVALRRFLDDKELDELIAWINNLPTNPSNAEFKDYAYFAADPLETLGSGGVFELIADPKLYCMTLKAGAGGLQRGTAGIQVNDEAAERIVRAEAAQLPKSGPGIIVLDLSGVTGGVKKWAALIEKRLQSNLNRRINAVILATDIRSTKGPEPGTRVLVHPNPRTPIPIEIAHQLEEELDK